MQLTLTSRDSVASRGWRFVILKYIALQKRPSKWQELPFSKDMGFQSFSVRAPGMANAASLSCATIPTIPRHSYSATENRILRPGANVAVEAEPRPARRGRADEQTWPASPVSALV